MPFLEGESLCTAGTARADSQYGGGLLMAWRPLFRTPTNGGSCAENDKIGYEHETWLTPAAVEALQITRRAQPVISEWVFPAPSDPATPISRHLRGDWWERGQALAKFPPEPGRGWHSLRRQFATEMEHAPLKDLCALGGWKSPQTVLTCYQRADGLSMQQALAARRRLEA